MVELVRGLSGSNLPCDGCYWFKFAYPQLMNLAEAKLYDITQFFQYSSLIYDLSFLYRNSVSGSQICYTRSSICVCVCVWRERERERESRWWIGLNAKATEKDPRAFICVVYM